ncbi:MAG: YiiX family permuted papain-like enzyme [Candidatus Korobacteraceae bacterium]
MLARVPGLILVLAALSACQVSSRTPDVRDGDIIFQTSRSAQSAAIQRATGSPYSHMGIILLQDGRPYVLEAATTVRYTPLESWISRGEGGTYVIKRLKNASALLTPAAVQKLQAEAARYRDKEYDLTFEWTDRRIYCSELVWKMLKRGLGVEVGQLQKLGDFRLDDPLVHAKLQERYGDHPLEEPVIAPSEMFNSPLLEKITEK